MKEQRRYIATNFWTVMRQQGRKLRWLAGELGIPENAITQMKTGRRAIPHSFAVSASRAIGVPMELVFSPVELSINNETNTSRDDERAAD